MFLLCSGDLRHEINFRWKRIVMRKYFGYCDPFWNHLSLVWLYLSIFQSQLQFQNLKCWHLCRNVWIRSLQKGRNIDEYVLLLTINRHRFLLLLSLLVWTAFDGPPFFFKGRIGSQATLCWLIQHNLGNWIRLYLGMVILCSQTKNCKWIHGSKTHFFYCCEGYFGSKRDPSRSTFFREKSTIFTTVSCAFLSLGKGMDGMVAPFEFVWGPRPLSGNIHRGS